MKLKVISVRMLLLVVCLLAGFTAGAQQTLIDVKVDTADILVGEQTTLHVTVTTDPNRRIIIPLPSDTLMTGVEVISVSDADSTVADGRLVIRRDILVTSFDSSLYLLPPFIAIDGADTIASNQVALKVSTALRLGRLLSVDLRRSDRAVPHLRDRLLSAALPPPSVRGPR